MSNQDDDRFRVRPGAPKQRGDAFINKVLRQTNKAGAKLGKTVGKVGQRPGSRLGRGHVVARFAGASLTPNARRVTIKARLVNLSKAGPRSTISHLRYIEREGVDRQGGPGHAYGPTTDAADTAAFEDRGREDRHQFRFIVSPEDAEQLDDLRTYTRHLMARMEADLGTRLDWVAVDHWNTDNPHTHVVLRGKDDTGKDLIISRDYIAEGMRHRATELATEWLGPRTELEIQRAMQREVDQERWTGLDRTLQRVAVDGLVRSETLAEPRLQRQRQMLIGRLQHLQRMGLATEQQPGTWAIHADAEPTLRVMGERGDIIRTMQRAMSGKQRELAVFQPGEDGRTIVGRVVGKGLSDELHDKGYLFARFDERFDGAPTLLILDEAWLFLDDPVFAARIRQWLKTLRKKNVSVIFATQSLADIKDSTIAPAIIESCASRIFLPNPQATEPQIRTIYEGFGLNSRQIEIVATAQPKRDYYYQSRLGNRLFDLDLGPVALAFAGASTPQDQRAIDSVLRDAGTPGFSGAWLRHRGLDWAADLLLSAPSAASFLASQPLEVSP